MLVASRRIRERRNVVHTAMHRAILVIFGSTQFAFCQQPEVREVEDRVIDQLVSECEQSKLAASLLRELGCERDGSDLPGIGGVKDRCRCVFYGSYYDTQMQRRKALVFVPNLPAVPPLQRKTVVITNQQYTAIAWAQVSGARDLLGTELAYDDDGTPVLRMTCVAADGKRNDVYTFALRRSEIVQLDSFNRITLFPYTSQE